METLDLVETHVNRPKFKSHYDNYIGGKWVPPLDGEYFDNESPVDGSLIAKMPRSKAADIDMAVGAAHRAFATWSKRPRRSGATSCSRSPT